MGRAVCMPDSPVGPVTDAPVAPVGPVTDVPVGPVGPAFAVGVQVNAALVGLFTERAISLPTMYEK